MIGSMSRELDSMVAEHDWMLIDRGARFPRLRSAASSRASTCAIAGLDVAEISFLLGFSHPNSFFRAFKRWTRSSPEVYRSARPD